MNAIDTLSNEHGLIRRFLERLDAAAEAIRQGKRPPREFYDLAVQFARTFADTVHHFKEEHVLFVRLAQRQEGVIDAQVEALRHQHERGRRLVTQLSGHLPAYAEGSVEAAQMVLATSNAYSDLLRDHIHREDHEFYPLARRVLTEDDMSALAEEFERDRQRRGGVAFEVAHKQLVDMGSLLTHLG